VRALLNRILLMQAENTAANVRQFIREIESQVGWTMQLLWSAGTIDQRPSQGCIALFAPSSRVSVPTNVPTISGIQVMLPYDRIPP
jgi:hypothetical protein